MTETERGKYRKAATCFLRRPTEAIQERACELLTWFFINSTFTHWWFCHRMPSRSFFLKGRQFHLCARCTGLIVGPIVAPLVALIPLPPAAGAVALLVLALDGSTQFVGWRESKNWVRFGTGICTSATISAAILRSMV